LEGLANEPAAVIKNERIYANPDNFTGELNAKRKLGRKSIDDKVYSDMTARFDYAGYADADAQNYHIPRQLLSPKTNPEPNNRKATDKRTKNSMKPKQTEANLISASSSIFFNVTII